MSDEKGSAKRRWMLFAAVAAGGIAVLLGVIAGVSAFLEWRWQNQHATSTDSSRGAASGTDSSRTTVSGVVVQLYLGKEGAKAALKLQTTAFGDLDCTFKDGQGDQIAAIKVGDFIVVEGEVVEKDHQFLKCRLIRNWQHEGRP